MIQLAKGSVSKPLRLGVVEGEDVAVEEVEAVDQSLVINPVNEVLQIKINSILKAIPNQARTIKMVRKKARVKLVRIPLMFEVRKQNLNNKFKVRQKNQ